ncbi:MAG: hypothetical protein LKJ25_10630 [Clostridia bacterium]|jgi:hypothetical protein|nr:hypothetical protein [Clostridia bacterium]
MKHKKTFIVMIVLIFSVMCVLIWRKSPNRFLKNISSSDVSYIEIFNGGTGNSIKVSDENDIEYIIDNIKGIKFYKRKMSAGYMGYRFRISFYNNDNKQLAVLIINSENTLRKDPFFYNDKTSSLCYKYINNLFD